VLQRGKSALELDDALFEPANLVGSLAGHVPSFRSPDHGSAFRRAQSRR
jgi:hypothetical protein